MGLFTVPTSPREGFIYTRSSTRKFVGSYLNCPYGGCLVSATPRLTQQPPPTIFPAPPPYCAEMYGANRSWYRDRFSCPLDYKPTAS